MPPTKVELGATCVPGQLDTKAYCRTPVILVSIEGQFGTGGSITLTADSNQGNPEPMGVVAGAAWTPYAIAATFPTESPGDQPPPSGEQFTITVNPNGGVPVVISPVNIFSLDGEGGYPPTM